MPIFVAMKGIFRILILLVYSTLGNLTVSAQILWKDVIQITGLTMTADSLRAVPDVTISVMGQNRGTYSSPHGVFSLAVTPGDTLLFTAIGFRAKEYQIPPDIEGKYFNMVQLMVQDTFYLPETIIRALPYGDEFDYAFKYFDVPDDQYAIAERNTGERTLKYLAAVLPKDGRENQATYQRQKAYEATFYGQQRPIGIFNPFKWNEFFQAWKRGDFRKK